MDDIQILDLRNAQQVQNTPSPFNIRFTTFKQLQDFFGIIVDRSQGWDSVQTGKRTWKLRVLYIDWGGSQYIAKVQDENDNPLPNISVVNWWPDVKVEVARG